MDDGGWDSIEREAEHAHASFPLPAYSELMPAPHVGIKPYAPTLAARAATAGGAPGVLDVDEYEQARQLDPGLAKIGQHVLVELDRLIKGKPHALSSTLLADNPAWPAVLKGRAEPITIALSVALSRTQDDKGNARWTLFGGSHEGAGAAFWSSFSDTETFARWVAWATGGAAVYKILEEVEALPESLRAFVFREDQMADVEALVTFRPFSALPARVQQAYLDGRIKLAPHPAGAIFFHHRGYARLGETLPRALQISLLHLFPRVEDGYGLRIPQSGWLDENSAGAAGGHKLVHHVTRTHRWQRVGRDAVVPEAGTYEDKVSVALFSTDPVKLGLYDKPMARNAQVWSEDYALILDGPRATHFELERAAQAVDRGGRFGYRFVYPPMRAGGRELFWHRPIVARLGVDTGGKVELFDNGSLRGHISAESPGRASIRLAPRVLRRAGHVEAATLFDHDAGRARHTTSNNVRKVLEAAELAGGPVAPSVARSLVRTAKREPLDAWLETLPQLASDEIGGARCLDAVKAAIGAPVPPSADLTFAQTATRAFEEKVWKSIAGLTEGEFRMKETADAVLVNKGKTGGPAAKAAHLELAARRDLDRLADHLHDRYRALIAAAGMTGRALVADHLFRWETEFPFRWSEAWNKNQLREMCERNVVCVIPGANRGEAVVMADHYDTAYMEDVYDEDRGGDGLRAAAAGADDNHSATTALLLAAEALLPLAAAGKLARDVWLVHLTGEEFPADCLGARALARALVEKRLRLAGEGGRIVDVSRTRVVGAYVLDMIAHNTERDRDVFQIAPGEGAASARLALRAHAATEKWNRAVDGLNAGPDRKGKGRAQRMEDGAHVPPAFAHLKLHGEIRPEWDPRSALFNTDGQIFSDVGVPVVLFMENYDISRTGYHDTHDTMKNIDLDYAAALTAIAIESVADAATE